MSAVAMKGIVPDRRSEPRGRTFKSGKIAFNQHFSVYDCLVRNLTKRGACLDVGDTLGVPTTFDLILSDRTTLRCRSVWRFGDRIGVVFE